MKKQILFIVLVLLLACTSAILPQNKRRTRETAVPKIVSPPPETAAPKIVINQNAKSQQTPAKKNGRSEEKAANQIDDQTIDQKKNANSGAQKTNVASAKTLPFAYEFSQPQFNVSRVVIEHDRNGKGQITFRKKELNESLTDPLAISLKVSERINNLWNELDFLNSTENYQSEKQFPHLGVMKLRESAGEKQREVEFNWTENKAVNDLTNEYKKITEQAIWIFEMNLARENQPLSAPQLVNRLQSMVNRNQISDSQQLLPLLQEIVDDERLPLIARNQTGKIIKLIEKTEK